MKFESAPESNKQTAEAEEFPLESETSKINLPGEGTAGESRKGAKFEGGTSSLLAQKSTGPDLFPSSTSWQDKQ